MAKEKKAKPGGRNALRQGEVRIHKASALSLPQSIMLYSEPGRGKTRLAGSIIEVEGIDSVLMFDIDNGGATIATDFPGVDIVSFKRGDIKTFEREFNEVVASDGLYEGVQYDAIVIDTMTTLHAWKLKELPKSLGWDRWDLATEFVMGVLGDLQDMKPLGISTWHSEVANSVKGSDSKDFIKLIPSVQGKAAKVSIGSVPDLIGMLEVDEVDDELQFTVMFDPTSGTITKNRFPKLPGVVSTDGGFKRIYQMILEGA